MGVISAAVGPPQAVTCQPLHEGEGGYLGLPAFLVVLHLIVSLSWCFL